MCRKSIITFLLALLVAAVPATAADAPVLRPTGVNTLVLFGARWCAPCLVEIRELPAIVKAASPDRVTLAWVDRRYVPQLPEGSDTVTILPAVASRRLAVRLAGEGYGLPLAALLDSDGKACALWRGPLRPADVQTLRRRCAS